MKVYFSVLLALLLSAGSFAQSSFVSGEYIVQLKKGSTKESFHQEAIQSNFELSRNLSKRFNIWLCQGASGDEQSQLKLLQQLPSVAVAQLNHHVQLRATLPNDPQFTQQWSLQNTGQSGGTAGADIEATLAWDVTTGGLTATGDSIVVAVIDGGFQLNHPDLEANFFVNHAEIPNNNIDDDGNGYIDDVSGWNAYDDDGIIPSDQHGTHVSGIIGAIGNNAIGIAGVNWNVKILPIAGSSGNESTVVAAYAYAAEMRIQYNETNGAQGAFVVATNSSFGVDQGDPAEFPIWCAFYDTLGSLGILSAGATANANSNIDNVGDIPTACASEFLIAVTNSTRNDTKLNGAGYGVQSIDIAAPGTAVYSAVTNSNYANLTGTSMATPHVAGTVALMYSAACELLINDYKVSPAALSLIMKQYLYSGAEQIPAFDGLVNSQRRLNVNGAVQQVLTYVCNAEAPPFANFSLASTSGCPGLMLNFNNNSSSNATNYLWEFPGGNPSSSTLQNPQVTYNNFGEYNVKLIASNIYGADTLEFANFVTITNTGTRSVYSENFETGTLESLGFDLVNGDNLNTWNILSTSGNTSGTKSVGINLYSNASNLGQRDYLISPSIALNQTSNNILNVRFAHRRRTASIADSLIISVSPDQGANWIRLEVLAGGSNSPNQLATSVLLNSSFTPSSSGDWCSGTQCLAIDISAYDGNPAAKFRFEAYNSGGNNIYVDDIKVSGQCTVPIISEAQADFTSNTNACVGNSLQFNNLSNNATSYQWSFPGGNPETSVSINPSVIYNQPGFYSVSLIASNSMFIDTVEYISYVNVNQSPEIPVIEVNESTYSTSASGNLQWYLNGQVIQGATGSSIEATAIGSYTVVVTNTAGCSSISVPQIVTSIGQLTSILGINVYPNPALDFVIISNQTNQTVQFELYDQLGRILQQGLVSETLKVNIADLSAGIYILRLQSRDAIKSIQLIHP